VILETYPVLAELLKDARLLLTNTGIVGLNLYHGLKFCGLGLVCITARCPGYEKSTYTGRLFHAQTSYSEKK